MSPNTTRFFKKIPYFKWWNIILMTKISRKNEPSKRNLDTFKRAVNYIENTRSLKLLDFKDYDSEKKTKQAIDTF